MKMKFVLPTVLLLWLCTSAPSIACYSPSTGRWLSRDPIAERGNDDPLEGEDDLSLYGIAHNDPLNTIDRLGLLTFSSGCTEQQKRDIKQAFDKACSKAKTCRHRFCLDDLPVSRAMKNTCDGKDLHVVCHPKYSRLNLCLTLKGDENCGWTSGFATIALPPKNWTQFCRSARTGV